MKRFLDYICETAPSSEAASIEKQLSKKFKLRKRTKSQNANIIIVEISDGNRIETQQEIAKYIHGEVDSHPLNVSSIGCVKVGNVKILVKTAGRTGKNSAGVENEHMLVDAINAVCNKTNKIDLKFQDQNGKVFMCKNVSGADAVGTDTANRKKADLIIHGSEYEYPISLKKDNAEIWESADSYEGEEALAILDAALGNGVTSIEEDDNGIAKISPSIAWKADDSKSADVVFGSDIMPTGCIIQKTFGRQVLQQTGADEWTCNVTTVMTSLDDIPESHEVWFLLRNDSTRTLAKKIKGLRVLAVFKSRVVGSKKNVVLVDKNGKKLK